MKHPMVNSAPGMIRSPRVEMGVAKASEQFKQSDVTRWGLTALLSGAAAVLCANIALQVPPSMLTWLHSSRLEAVSVAQLRIDLANLTRQTQKLQRDNISLVNRLSLVEDADGDFNRRVGALEVSIPALLEALPAGADIDRAAVTAGIDTKTPAETFEADGGLVSVTQSPMPGLNGQLAAIAPANQPIPPIPDVAAYGVALGPSVTADQARATWDDLTLKVGTLLAGLEPLVSDDAGGGRHLVAGPIVKLGDATALCARLEQVAISCLPMPYAGRVLGD